jgi:hypothetical protein
MAQKIALGLIAAIVLGISAPKMALAADMGRSSRSIGTVQHLGFWGEPFPYGYRWSLVRACSRYESEETSHGTKWHHVWVCDVKAGYAYR